MGLCFLLELSQENFPADFLIHNNTYQTAQKHLRETPAITAKKRSSFSNKRIAQAEI